MQYASYPPNFGFFEWNEVDSVDTENNQITLTKSVQFTYRDDWPEFEYYSGQYGGQAAIIKDRTMRSLTIRDGLLIPNPNAEGLEGKSFYVSARTVLLENLEAPGIYYAPTCSEMHTAKNCEFLFVEVDKCLGNFQMDRSVIHNQPETKYSVTAGTGARRIALLGNTINGSIIVSPFDNLVIRDNTINATATSSFDEGVIKPYPSFGATKTAIIEDNSIYYDADYDAIISLYAATELTVASVDGTSIVLAINDANIRKIGWLRAGSFLHKADMSKYGRVTGIVENAGDFVLSGTWPAPVAAEVWCCYRYEDLQTARNILIGPLPRPPFRSVLRAPMLEGQHRHRLSLRLSTTADFASAISRIEPLGTVVCMTVLVTRAYSGPDTAARMTLATTNPAYTIGTIDLTTTGMREITFTTPAELGSDDLDPLQASPCRSLTVTALADEQSEGITGTDQQMPDLLIEVEVVPAA